MYEIEICPLKMLYEIAMGADLRRAAALVVSSYQIKTEHLTGLAGVLPMHFADTANERTADAFSIRQAEQIKAFLDALPAGLETLFVCCDSGESRSTAMTAAILRRRGLDEWTVWKNPRYHPNPLVYRRLCGALGVPVSDDELRLRLDANEAALAQAINARRRKKL